MEKNRINNSEILYRVVRKSDPDSYIDGKPTAALFIDEEGASIERDGERTENEIIKKFRDRFRRNNDYITSVKISAGECRDLGTCPKPINNNRNIYHGEIHDSETVTKISLIKALQLASNCVEVATNIE